MHLSRLEGCRPCEAGQGTRTPHQILRDRDPHHTGPGACTGSPWGSRSSLASSSLPCLRMRLSSFSRQLYVRNAIQIQKKMNAWRSPHRLALMGTVTWDTRPGQASLHRPTKEWGPACRSACPGQKCNQGMQSAFVEAKGHSLLMELLDMPSCTQRAPCRPLHQAVKL